MDWRPPLPIPPAPPPCSILTEQVEERWVAVRKALSPAYGTAAIRANYGHVLRAYQTMGTRIATAIQRSGMGSGSGGGGGGGAAGGGGGGVAGVGRAAVAGSSGSASDDDVGSSSSLSSHVSSVVSAPEAAAGGMAGEQQGASKATAQAAVPAAGGRAGAALAAEESRHCWGTPASSDAHKCCSGCHRAVLLARRCGRLAARATPVWGGGGKRALTHALTPTLPADVHIDHLALAAAIQLQSEGLFRLPPEKLFDTLEVGRQAQSWAFVRAAVQPGRSSQPQTLHAMHQQVPFIRETDAFPPASMCVTLQVAEALEMVIGTVHHYPTQPWLPLLHLHFPWATKVRCPWATKVRCPWATKVRPWATKVRCPWATKVRCPWATKVRCPWATKVRRSSHPGTVS
jgi:hypothetical protein